jgi:hypothetical protein
MSDNKPTLRELFDWRVLLQVLDPPFRYCVVSSLAGVLILIILTVISLLVLNFEFLATLLPICIIGWGLGGLIGFLIIPHTREDETRASKIFELVGAFVTGGLISQVQPFLEAVRESDQVKLTMLCALYLVVSFLSIFLLVMVYRLYVERPWLKIKNTAGMNGEGRANQPGGDDGEKLGGLS